MPTFGKCYYEGGISRYMHIAKFLNPAHAQRQFILPITTIARYVTLEDAPMISAISP